MYKEFIIILTLLIIVIGLDIITNNYVKETVKVMTNELEILKQEILNNNEAGLQEKMKKIKDIWQKKYSILAYYIEHDELEKVEIQIAVLGANLESESYKNSIEDIEEAIYILKHIEEKDALNLKSIF